MLIRPVIHAFAEKLLGSDEIHIELEPLQGGLEAEGVSLIRARRAGDGAAGVSFVVKPLANSALREYRVQSAVQRTCLAAAPQILGSAPGDGGRTYVFMEWIAAAEHWPWHQKEHAASVLQQLARVHDCDLQSVSPVLHDWDYDADLKASAETTVDLYGQLFNSGFRIGERPMLRSLERIADAVVQMRAQAVQFTGAAMLHGDVHPGNAVLREVQGALEPVLLDWGRARVGSPLEDVTSWLHSLGFWEPNARRIHDTLLMEYRRASGLTEGLTSGFRSAAWLAGACNAMSGALRYHLAVAADPEGEPETRWTSSLAAGDWLRILRRADAIWKG